MFLPKNCITVRRDTCTYYYYYFSYSLAKKSATALKPIANYNKLARIEGAVLLSPGARDGAAAGIKTRLINMFQRVHFAVGCALQA